MSILNLFGIRVSVRGAFKSVRSSRCFSKIEENVVRSHVPDVSVPNTLLHDHLWRGLDKWRDKVAVECAETRRTLTYGQIRKKSRSLAGFLQKYGLKKGDAIAIVLPNVPEYFIALMGALEAGVIIVPINPIYTSEEIKRQLIASKAKMVISLNSMFPVIEKACNELPNIGRLPIIVIKHTENESSHAVAVKFEEVISRDYDGFREPEMSTDDIALLPFSSGTTGLPKGVQLSHGNLVANYCQTSAPDFKMNIDTEGDNQDVVPIVLPMYHLYGLGCLAFTYFQEGVKFVTVPNFNTETFNYVLHDCRASLLYIVPPLVLMLLNNPSLHLERVSRLRAVLSAAAPLGAADINRFSEKTQGKINLLQMYGMTETSPLTHHQSFTLKHGMTIGGSGFTVPNTLCKIIDVDDPNCKGLGPNVNGELLIKGPQVMKGYLNNEKANKETFHNGWMRTGDIAHYDEHFHFFITDRLKELIKVKGYQVAPAELEELLRDHPDVSDAAVIGIPDERNGEVPKAFVVPRKGSKIKPEDVVAFTTSKVAKYKQLAGGVVFLENIPKTASGKILRRELKKL